MFSSISASILLFKQKSDKNANFINNLAISDYFGKSSSKFVKIKYQSYFHCQSYNNPSFRHLNKT